MKYVIMFAFAAFAFLAQADAQTALFELLLGIGDRVVADYLKEELAAAKEKLEEMLNKAQDALKEKTNEAKKKAEHLIEQLKQIAGKISDKVLEAANKILDKLEASVAEIIREKSHNIEGISECMIMKDNFRQAVLSVIANTSSCINDKIEEAQSYVTGIHKLTTEAVGAIKEVKEQGIECTRDVSGTRGIAAAIGCVTRASVKGTAVVGQTVPKVARLIKEMMTLSVSLLLCMPTKAAITLGQQVEPVIVSIRDCIQEKVEESKAPKESSEEEQTIVKESHKEIRKKEHTEVQSNFGYEAPVKCGPITVQMFTIILNPTVPLRPCNQ